MSFFWDSVTTLYHIWRLSSVWQHDCVICLFPFCLACWWAAKVDRSQRDISIRNDRQLFVSFYAGKLIDSQRSYILSTPYTFLLLSFLPHAVADLEGVEPARQPPPPWATHWHRHGTADKWKWYCIMASAKFWSFYCKTCTSKYSKWLPPSRP